MAGLLAPAGRAMALSAAAQAAILPAHQALLRARQIQARQGPAADLADRLVRLGALDQAARAVLPRIDLSGLPPEERVPASTAMWAEIAAQDAADQAALMALLPARGWFTEDRYGAKASLAAWSVVQHATDNLPLMKEALARMAPAARAHEVRGAEYGMLADRVAMLEGSPQRYGTQFKCVDHHWSLYALVDPKGVEERRRAIGMTETAAEEWTRIRAYPPCYFKK